MIKRRKPTDVRQRLLEEKNWKLAKKSVEDRSKKISQQICVKDCSWKIWKLAKKSIEDRSKKISQLMCVNECRWKIGTEVHVIEKRREKISQSTRGTMSLEEEFSAIVHWGKPNRRKDRHRSPCHREAARDIFPNDARHNVARRRVVECNHLNKPNLS